MLQTLDDFLIKGRPKAEQARVLRLVKDTFDTTSGRLLLNEIMARGPHPMRSRFSISDGGNATAAAYRDGQCDPITFFYINSGIKLMTPVEQRQLEKADDQEATAR